MTSQAITQDLSSPLGSNSLYLCRPLSACHSLFDGQELDCYVHAYQCKCGNTKMMISNSSKHKNYSCHQCQNKQFLGERTYSNFYGELLAKIDMPVKYTISGTYVHATLYFAKPIGIDLNRSCLLYAPKEAFILSLNLKTAIFQETYKYLFTDDLPSYATAEFLAYIEEKHLNPKLKNYDLLQTKHCPLDERKKIVKYFLRYTHIKDAVMYYWYIPHDLHMHIKKHNTLTDTLQFLMHQRKESSVRRAVYERYFSQIKRESFDTVTVYVVCKVFKDPNLVCKLLKNHSFSLSKRLEKSFFVQTKLLF